MYSRDCVVQEGRWKVSMHWRMWEWDDGNPVGQSTGEEREVRHAGGRGVDLRWGGYGCWWWPACSGAWCRAEVQKKEWDLVSVTETVIQEFWKCAKPVCFPGPNSLCHSHKGDGLGPQSPLILDFKCKHVVFRVSTATQALLGTTKFDALWVSHGNHLQGPMLSYSKTLPITTFVLPNFLYLKKGMTEKNSNSLAPRTWVGWVGGSKDPLSSLKLHKPTF